MHFVSLTVHVVPDISEIETKVATKFPEANLIIQSTTDGMIVLSGTVSPEEINEIEAYVAKHWNLPIRNELSDKKPIALRWKVYEVSKTKLKNQGIEWLKPGSDLRRKVSSFKDLLPVGGNAKDSNLVLAQLDDSKDINEMIDELEKRNVASLIDQPTLVARDGTPAEFASGGEIPIAIENENGQKQIEFRSYGTRILTTPHIHSEDLLTVEVNAEVSELVPELSGDTGVPGFRVRRVNTGVRMKKGQTLVLVGDYRQQGPKKDTELVFLMTPQDVEFAANNQTKPEPELRR